MNPHYQYAILEEFSNADATLRQASIKEQPSPPISNRLTETISNVRPITVRDNFEVAVPVRPLVSPVGGVATINLVNPIRLTPVASLEDTIESSTSEPTTKAQEGVTGGGGGGGIFGGGDSEEEEVVVGQPQIIKSILPLVVIAIGVSIIIFKPIK